MNACFFLTPVAQKSAAIDGEGQFRGLASTFGGAPDAHGDVIAPGAFAATLADHAAHDDQPALLWGHDPAQPIGKWLALQETSAGLEGFGKLTLDVPKAKEARALMRDGALGLSIGYRLPAGGYELKDGVRHIRQIELHEISVTPMPANRSARITEVKTAMNDPRAFEQAARDALGLSAREAKRLMSGGWAALVRDEPDPSEELAAFAAELRNITQSIKAKV